MTTEELEAVRRRNEERRGRKERATEGEWVEDDGHVFGRKQADERYRRIIAGVEGREPRISDKENNRLHLESCVAHCSQEWPKFQENADFIAAAKNDPVEDDVEALLAEVERLRTALEPFAAIGREQRIRDPGFLVVLDLEGHGEVGALGLGCYHRAAREMEQ